jgi:hypothetical protein
MLGEEMYEDLLKTLKEHKFLYAPASSKPLDDKDGLLLMLKPAATNEFIEGLLRSVWRLWRYGGGRRWMTPDSDKYVDWMQELGEIDVIKAEISRAKEREEAKLEQKEERERVRAQQGEQERGKPQFQQERERVREKEKENKMAKQSLTHSSSQRDGQGDATTAALHLFDAK